MILLQPKKNFIEGNNDAVKELRKVVQSSNFHLALVFALSEYVYTRTPTAEQILGVNEFTDVLLNLAMEDPPIKSSLAKTLDQTVYTSTKPPTR
jgi:hypothetical protein